MANAETTATLPVTEREFQAKVVQLARLFGWRVFHPRAALTGRGFKTAMMGDPGWPDLILLRPPRLLAVELKSAAGEMRPGQQDWLDGLAAVQRVESFVWRPADFEVEVVRALGAQR